MTGFAIKGRRRVGLISLVMMLGASTATVARAADVVLRVDGMACPFCAFGIEKKLLHVPAVAGMDILLNDGKVVLQLREGERLDAVALNRAVEDAGFTLSKILVENAIGILSRTADGELLLECSDPLAAFRLRLEAEAVLPGANSAGVTIRVAVTGELTEYIPEPALLATRSLSPVGEESGASR